jgi:hypothetical protein
MNALPSMNGQKTDRDNDGVVRIKSTRNLPVIFGGFTIIVAIDLFLFLYGQLLIGIGLLIGIVFGGIFALFLVIAGNVPPVEFDPNKRVFVLGTGNKAKITPFNEIAGFGANAEKKIFVILKNNEAIEIGLISENDENKEREKTSAFFKFLYEITKIVPPTDNGGSSEYLNWRQVIFNVKSAQTGVSSEESDKVYGVIMDIGKSENLGMTITAFPTGEASLRITTGGGTIGLGGYPEVGNQAKQIVSLGQTLLSTTNPTNSRELPEINNVFFYFLTTSGITRSEFRLDQIILENHPYHEIFSKFSMIEQKWVEMENSV